MKLGFFTMPIHPVGRDWRETLREDQEAFLLADALGYCEGYVGEHVTDLAENITSCTMFLASLAGRVKAMRLGTGTVNLPNSHPATVAVQIAMLDRQTVGIQRAGMLVGPDAGVGAEIADHQLDRVERPVLDRRDAGVRAVQRIALVAVIGARALAEGGIAALSG